MCLYLPLFYFHPINLMTNDFIILKIDILLLNHYSFISWNMRDIKEQLMSGWNAGIISLKSSLQYTTTIFQIYGIWMSQDLALVKSR